MYGYHYLVNAGVTYSSFHSYHGRHAFWKEGQELPFPGKDPRVLLRSRAACHYGYLLTRTPGIPRWQHLEPRVTFMGKSSRYSLWRLNHDQMPTCRKGKKVASTPPERLAKSTSAEEPSLDNLLAPLVGHARGRSLQGGWAPPADDRPRRPQERRDQRPERAAAPKEAPVQGADREAP